MTTFNLTHLLLLKKLIIERTESRGQRSASESVSGTPAGGGSVSQIPYKLTASSNCDRMVTVGRQERKGMSAGFTIFHEVTEQVEILGLRWAVLEPKLGAEGVGWPLLSPGVRSPDTKVGCWHWGSLGSRGSPERSSLITIWVTDAETLLGLIMEQEQTLSQLIPVTLQQSRAEHSPVEEHVPWRAQSDNFQDGRNIFPEHILLGILKLSPLECTEYVRGSEAKPASTHPKAHFQMF